MKRRPDWRMKANGYAVVYRPEHGSANSVGMIKEHVFIVEVVLGKRLPKGADVHHINGIRDDNRKENLVVCQGRAYHFLLHIRQRALEACGTPSWRKCCICQSWGPPETVSNHRHKACARTDSRRRWWQQKYGTEPPDTYRLRRICVRGHPLSGDNLKVYGNGKRVCRICQSAHFTRITERRRREREAARA